MTVNTLGTDSRLDSSRTGGDALAAGSPRRSWTDSRWPLLAICIALFSISALVYYHLYRTGLEPTKLLPRLFAGIYHVVGFAPSLLFFLMVAIWGAIWLSHGVLERPLSRLGRLLMMAALLGVTLNLGDVGGDLHPHKGAFGAWLAQRLVDSIGYVPTLVLVWPATFASLVLATEFFFSDYFERLRHREGVEVGVEAAVTDHLRGLSEAAAAASLRPAVSSGAPAPMTLRAATPPAVVDLTAAGIEDEEFAAALAEPVDDSRGESFDDALGGDVDADDEDGSQRLSYAERRAARQARRAAMLDFDEDLEHDVSAVDAPADDAPAVDAAAAIEPEAGAEPATGSGSERSEAELAEPAHLEPEVAAIPDEGLSDAEVFAIMASIDAVEDEASAVELVDEPSAAAEESGHAAANVESEAAESESPASQLLHGFIRLDGDALPTDSSAHDTSADGEAAEVVETVAGLDEALEDQLEDELEDEPVQSSAEADASAPFEPGDEASEPWSDEAEPAVAIPRPEAVNPTPPTPPSVKQQQLFGGADEALVREAIELVVDSRRATAALLQRKLRVDYELACELLRELASRGIVALEGDASRARVLDG